MLNKHSFSFFSFFNNSLFFKCFLLMFCVFFTSISTSSFAYAGRRYSPKRDIPKSGIDSIGVHIGGTSHASIMFKKCTWGEDSYIDDKGVCQCKSGYELKRGKCRKRANPYCERTNDTGACASWATCAYESSGDKIIGVPNADGGCAQDDTQRIVCSDTDKKGFCDSWTEPCLKTDEYHGIIGTPLARSLCCEKGHNYCTRTNQAGQCVSWECCDSKIHSGDKIVGVRDARGYCASSSQDLYCLATNNFGKCTKWAGCTYESSEDKIIGVPNARGGCAQGTAQRIICSNTNDKGQCNSWADFCLKTDEYHEITNTPLAHSTCCKQGHAYCAYMNELGKCTSWQCMECLTNAECNSNACVNGQCVE